MENGQKNRYSSALEKVTIDIRGASVMFLRGMCISTLWSFQNQCRVNTFMLETIVFDWFKTFFWKKLSMVKAIKYQSWYQRQI